MRYIFLLLAMTLNATANISIKLGAEKMNKITMPKGITLQLWELGKNYYLIAGILFFVLNIIFYFLALTKIQLSIAYPIMTSGGFLVISLASIFIFNETLTVTQIAGIILITAGIILVASSV